MDRELEQKLNTLRHKLPVLLKEHPDASDFYHAFSQEVDVLTLKLKPEDMPWFEKQIALMLAECGRQRQSLK
jgi:hypothetical protein